ncbi:MAG: sulfurtransferase [Candidatus Sericytochromatia bacterium]|nr:sulfurtransferase [Candidatus Sericytochromatia bacterium]
MTSVAVPMEIDPVQYSAWRNQPEAHPHVLLDIREPWEHAQTQIAGDVLIPMNEVPQRMAEIPADQDLIVYCHHGVRSFQVVYYLRQQGYTRARSLSGGIARWSAEIDSTVPEY